jgi:hypothetical protein
MKAYYFGCFERAGHYMWEPGGAWGPRSAPHDFVSPWGRYPDGILAPKGQSQGVAALHHKDGWTAISCWDQSVDSRPGSNSTFLLEGTYTFAEGLELATQFFPSIMSRLPALVEYKP